MLCCSLQQDAQARLPTIPIPHSLSISGGEMKRNVVLVSALLLITAILAACGGAQPTATPVPPTAPPVEQPTQAPAEEPTQAVMEELTQAPEPTEAPPWASPCPK